jgi:DNA relaxase NicK
MSLTAIDWLGLRTQSGPADCIDALRGSFGAAGPALRAVPKKRGMSFGGDAMRGWVWIEITGKGCQWVEDWNQCEDDLAQLRDFQYKRVDIALDTYKREVTHETVIAAYSAGMFTTTGKPPSMRQIVPADPYEGRTAYVGKRDQPKFLRAYEKGYEQARNFPGLELTSFDGVPIADWYRLELELKAKQQLLPEDLIENRDQYFAGAYPYLQAVLDVEPQILKQSRDKHPQRTLASMLEVMRTQYGNTLFTALTAYQGDIGAVWEKIVGTKHNQKLVEEGVLMVDHQ